MSSKSSVLAAVLTGWIFCFVSAAATQQSDLETAKRAYLEGRFEDSIEVLKPLLGALTDESALREANFFLGLNYMALRHEADATSHFESAVRHDPGFLPSESIHSPEVVELYRSVRDRLVGRLRVESRPPGARVTVAGRDLGKAPVHQDVVAGEQVVRVELEGYEPQEQVVDVRPAEQANVSLVLSPIEAPAPSAATEATKEASAEPPSTSRQGGGGSGKTIGLIAGAGGGAAVLAAVAGGGGSDTTSGGPSGPAPGPTPSRANIQASIAPNPIIAQPSNDPEFPWLINFEVNVRETAGLGGNIDFINTTLVNAATGAEIPALNFGADEINGRAGTNHVNGGSSLTVPLGILYRLRGDERQAVLRAFVRFTDDRRNVLEAFAEAMVQ